MRKVEDDIRLAHSRGLNCPPSWERRAVARIDSLTSRLSEAKQLLRRAMNQSAIVHPDFMSAIRGWLDAYESEARASLSADAARENEQ